MHHPVQTTINIGFISAGKESLEFSFSFFKNIQPHEFIHETNIYTYKYIYLYIFLFNAILNTKSTFLQALGHEENRLTLKNNL